MTNQAALVEVRHVAKQFPVRSGLMSRRAKQYARAVDDVSLEIAKGEVLGLVGESGSGKTTLGRLILRLSNPDSGSILYDGAEITALGKSALRSFRRRMQVVFQDPYSSLNPRMTVGEAIIEPMIVHRMGGDALAQAERARALLSMVGLSTGAMTRFPHEFSGGQRQRIGIARALAVGPEFIVADEPVSALDVSVQAQVLNLLQDLKDELGLAILFIAHDLAVVRKIADRIGVMYVGRLVELAPTDELFSQPRHPYTEALLSAVPSLHAKNQRIVLAGELPSPLNPPLGCALRSRCPYALPMCAIRRPELRPVASAHWTACLRDDLPARRAT